MIHCEGRSVLDPQAHLQELMNAVIHVTGQRYHSLEAALDIILPFETRLASSAKCSLHAGSDSFRRIPHHHTGVDPAVSR